MAICRSLQGQFSDGWKLCVTVLAHILFYFFVVTILDLFFPTLGLTCGIHVCFKEGSSKEQLVVHVAIIEEVIHI